MAKFYDYIVIGSGAGGGAAAYYLAKSGAQVLLLEAGRRYAADAYPRNEVQANAQLLWGGGADLSRDASTVLLRGKVLGGGTVVNQALLDRFDDIAWRDLAADTGVSWFDSDAMARHYDAVESELSLHTFEQEEWNRNAALYVQGFEKLGYEWKPLRRGQGDCGKGNDCMMCLGGCARDSKQSTAVTFIRRAEAAGLAVETGFHAGQIIEGNGWTAVHGMQNGQQKVFYGGKCVVAAGALGTVGLMLKSGWQQRLPMLGKQFYCHPQWMSTAFLHEPVDAHKGYFQSVKSGDNRFRNWRFKLENVFAGPAGIALLNHYDFGKAHQDYMRRYRHMMCIEVALRDQTPGEIRLNGKGRLIVDKPLGQADLDNAAKGRSIVNDVFAAVGAGGVMSSGIRIGLHLMGGARMGQSAADSVVDEEFKVHGMRHVYVADGSLYPNAPGINPSLTIMALAHRAAEGILKQAGG